MKKRKFVEFVIARLDDRDNVIARRAMPDVAISLIDIYIVS